MPTSGRRRRRWHEARRGRFRFCGNQRIPIRWRVFFRPVMRERFATVRHRRRTVKKHCGTGGIVALSTSVTTMSVNRGCAPSALLIPEPRSDPKPQTAAGRDGARSPALDKVARPDRSGRPRVKATRGNRRPDVYVRNVTARTPLSATTNRQRRHRPGKGRRRKMTSSLCRGMRLPDTQRYVVRRGAC